MVQFLKRLLELQSYQIVLILCRGLVYSQLYSRLYPSRIWTQNSDVPSM